tara:strand:+ start:1734 stop:2711 length:978 start_codon:yes stop_codon:yes gene_type:complete
MSNLIKLDGSNLSIVIQGSLSSKEETIEIIKSYRAILPRSEIIISTWPDFKSLVPKNEIVVISEDPGPIDVSEVGGRINNNFNRQLISSKRGIAISSSTFVLKVRSDLAAIDNSIFKKYNEVIISSEKINKSYFKDKPLLVISNESSKKPGLFKGYLHFCDWFMLSKTKEISKIFNMNIVEKEDLLFREYEEIPRIYDELKLPKEKWSAETYMWTNYLRNYNDFKMLNEFDNSDTLKKVHDNFVADNLVILDYKKSGLGILKNVYQDRLFFKYNYEYSYDDWLLLSSRIELSHLKRLILSCKVFFVDRLKLTYSKYVKIRRFFRL